MSKSGRAAGIFLILAALVVFAAIMTRSDHSQLDNAAMFADVEAARTPEFVSAALFVLGAILFVPAGFGVARMAHGRGGKLTYVGAVMLTVGGMWFATGRAVSNVWLYAATAPGLPRTERLAAYEHFSSQPGFVVWVPLLLTFMAAPAVLALGLWRMKLVPVWAAPAWVASLVSFLVVEGDDLGEFVGFGLMTAVLCWIGIALIRHAAPERDVSPSKNPEVPVEAG